MLFPCQNVRFADVVFTRFPFHFFCRLGRSGHIADVGSSQRAFQRRYESYLSGTRYDCVCVCVSVRLSPTADPFRIAMLVCSMKSAETKIVLSQPESTRKLNQSAWRRFVTWLYDHQLGTTALLMVLGALAALLDFGLGRAIAGLLSSRVTLMDKSTSWLAQYSIFVLYGTFIFSIGYITVRYISTMAAGSGIPEISTILSGVDIPGFLNFRTLLSKVLGLLFVLGSGMQGGREGPFVHISAAIGTLLMKLPFFHKIRKSKVLERKCTHSSSSFILFIFLLLISVITITSTCCRRCRGRCVCFWSAYWRSAV